VPEQPLYNEKELLAMLSAGSEKAFRLIYDLYKTRLYGVAFKMTKSEHGAEEILQETFLNIWTYKERLQVVEDPAAYIFTVAYNKIFGYLRNIAKDSNLLAGMISRMPNHANDTVETIEFHESELLISEAVKKLPPQRRLIFQLSRQEGLNYDEIAERLHISRNTVRNQLVEALKFIRAYIMHAATWLLLLLEINKK
jgi:RNA polymerase sigma-70 factor (family 1)